VDLEKRPQQTHPEPGPAGLRASDADRDRTADILRDALAEGRLTAEEHGERIDGVYRAKTMGELEPLVRDLPAASGATHATAAPRPAPSRPSDGVVPPVADENLVAVFSSSVRKGRWRVGRRTHAYAIFGNVEMLDSAERDAPVVFVDGFAVLGNIEAKPKRGKLVRDQHKQLRKHLGH